jgi:hypothetical protein
MSYEIYQWDWYIQWNKIFILFIEYTCSVLIGGWDLTWCSLVAEFSTYERHNSICDCDVWYDIEGSVDWQFWSSYSLIQIMKNFVACIILSLMQYVILWGDQTNLFFYGCLCSKDLLFSEPVKYSLWIVKLCNF